MSNISKIDEMVSSNESTSQVISETIKTELESAISAPTVAPSLGPSCTKKQKVENSIGWNSAIAILMESSKEGFNRIRSVLLSAFNLESYLIPSYYYVTKHRPKVNIAVFQVLDRFSF